MAAPEAKGKHGNKKRKNPGQATLDTMMVPREPFTEDAPSWPPARGQDRAVEWARLLKEERNSDVRVDQLYSGASELGYVYLTAELDAAQTITQRCMAHFLYDPAECTKRTVIPNADSFGRVMAKMYLEKFGYAKH